MKRSTERTLSFILFLILTFASAFLEFFLIYKIIDSGDISTFKAITSIVNLGALIFFIRAFAKLVNKTFIEKDFICEEDLKKFFRNRLDRINGLSDITPENKAIVFNNLLNDILRMTEEVLRNWLGDYQYELSVFADSEQPDIIAYYETGGQDIPRSKTERQTNPYFYKTSGYKVIELLENPTHEVLIISKTNDPQVNYKFLNQKQRERIKSTLLYSFCFETPMALVVVCDAPGAIDKKDRRLINFVNAVGLAMNFDCQLSKKIYSNLKLA